MSSAESKAVKDLEDMTKEEFLTQVRSQMHAWQSRFDEFKAKGKAARDLGGSEYQHLVTDLQDKVAAYEEELRRIEEIPGEAWRKIALVVVNWYDEMDDRLREAMKRLK